VRRDLLEPAAVGRCARHHQFARAGDKADVEPDLCRESREIVAVDASLRDDDAQHTGFGLDRHRRAQGEARIANRGLTQIAASQSDPDRIAP
jgi:hypothetical protein